MSVLGQENAWNFPLLISSKLHDENYSIDLLKVYVESMIFDEMKQKNR